jgi:hypothetical protein
MHIHISSCTHSYALTQVVQMEGDIATPQRAAKMRAMNEVHVRAALDDLDLQSVSMDQVCKIYIRVCVCVCVCVWWVVCE